MPTAGEKQGRQSHRNRRADVGHSLLLLLRELGLLARSLSLLLLVVIGLLGHDDVWSGQSVQWQQ